MQTSKDGVIPSGLDRVRHAIETAQTNKLIANISTTGVKRELRPTLRLDNAAMGSVDIRCAQPALLAIPDASREKPPQRAKTP